MLCLLGRTTLTALPEEVLEMIVVKLCSRDNLFGSDNVRSQQCLRLFTRKIKHEYGTERFRVA